MGSLKAPCSVQLGRSLGLEAELAVPESELTKLKKENEIYKTADPFNVVQMAIEIAIERARAMEAVKARDTVVQRLVDAQESVRQKSSTIELLQQGIQQKSRNTPPFMSELTPAMEGIESARLKDEIMQLERTIVDLRSEIGLLKANQNAVKPNEPPPPGYEEGVFKTTTYTPASPQQLLRENSTPIRSSSFPQSSPKTPPKLPAESSAPLNEVPTNDPASDEPADMAAARNAILSKLTLPEEVPDDTLSPLSIPVTLTLQDFLSSLSVPLRNSIAQYRLFYATTTLWCPEREEHGYFYAPLFKCSTNPRVATAHRWNSVDVIARMNKPTECFFNKDGIWYYAGVYKAFRLADLSTKEWAELPTETTQAIVKDTIAARKNTSPQNIYEVTQLYAAGALKVACVGLQCVGFNNAMYKSLLEQARTLTQNKWILSASGPNANLGKASPMPTMPTSTNVTGVAGLGSASPWGANSNIGLGACTGVGTGSVAVATSTSGDEVGDVVSGLGGISLGRRSQTGSRDENLPTPVGEGRKR